MKIGILGGSFDPIHYGHLHMAKKAKEEYRLDEVWLVPAGHSPNKDEQSMTSGNDRVNMCRLAADEIPWLKVDTLEVDSAERSYTYRTLQKLSERYPNNRFYFIMGADSLDYLEKWKHPEIICALADILVVNRDEFSNQDMEEKISQLKELFPCSIQMIHCKKYPVSSREIRKMISERKPADDYLPESVLQYIYENKLY